MSFTPDWAPNFHPLVVHFPIGVLVTAAAVDFLSLLMRNRPGVRDTATLLYCAGAALALVAYFTGRSAANGLVIPLQVRALVDEHAEWAFRTTCFFMFFASVRLAISYILQPKPLRMVGVFVLALMGIVLLYATAEHGAQLVFQHGLGVRKTGAIGP